MRPARLLPGCLTAAAPGPGGGVDGGVRSRAANHVSAMEPGSTPSVVLSCGKETVAEEEDEVAVGMEKGFMDEFFDQPRLSSGGAVEDAGVGRSSATRSQYDPVMVRPGDGTTRCRYDPVMVRPGDQYDPVSVRPGVGTSRCRFDPVMVRAGVGTSRCRYDPVSVRPGVYLIQRKRPQRNLLSSLEESRPPSNPSPGLMEP
ncbi:unnamed protein product [Gadus morhua 'NCC']